MAVHSIYAQISEGIVQNIMVCDDYELANELTRASYGDDGFAVECNQCPCVIGDKYHDGGFYRDIEGEGIEIPIEYVPTPEQQVEALTVQNGNLQNEVTSLQLALVEQYEDNIALQDEVTNTQLALTELYEEMEVQQMAQVYADLIRKGFKTLEQVPDKLKAEVEALLHGQVDTVVIFQKGGRGDGGYLCNADY